MHNTSRLQYDFGHPLFSSHLLSTRSIQPYRQLTGEAHGVTMRFDDILDLWRIAASHRRHHWYPGITTGGQDIGIPLAQSL